MRRPNANGKGNSKKAIGLPVANVEVPVLARLICLRHGLGLENIKRPSQVIEGLRPQAHSSECAFFARRCIQQAICGLPTRAAALTTSQVVRLGEDIREEVLDFVITHLIPQTTPNKDQHSNDLMGNESTALNSDREDVFTLDGNQHSSNDKFSLGDGDTGDEHSDQSQLSNDEFGGDHDGLLSSSCWLKSTTRASAEISATLKTLRTDGQWEVPENLLTPIPAGSLVSAGRCSVSCAEWPQEDLSLLMHARGVEKLSFPEIARTDFPHMTRKALAAQVRRRQKSISFKALAESLGMSESRIEARASVLRKYKPDANACSNSTPTIRGKKTKKANQMPKQKRSNTKPHDRSKKLQNAPIMRSHGTVDQVFNYADFAMSFVDTPKAIQAWRAGFDFLAYWRGQAKYR
ncbi:hypothetical protein AC578_4039 [Pseudocercospora eumusae]|uniref:Uncharacterized protein n=1 Tax=Pseudocercospora eumusae TaxID=321146 RepID=A0A139HE52_9PEZI|nr:hypothetical protein AC578_4039 [Pseudocercospora eumusae]